MQKSLTVIILGYINISNLTGRLNAHMNFIENSSAAIIMLYKQIRFHGQEYSLSDSLIIVKYNNSNN